MRALLLLGCLVSGGLSAAELSVTSPDKSIQFTFSDDSGFAQYTVTYNGEELMRPGRLGFSFADAKPIYKQLSLKEVSRDSANETWEQPWGEQRLINNHYNELVVNFSEKGDADNAFNVQVRVFDDGIGFRYHVDAEGPRTITREMTEFYIVDSHTSTAYWIPGQGYERQEYLYRETRLQDVDKASTTT